MRDLIFTMYRWVLSTQNLSLFTQESCVDDFQAMRVLIFDNPNDEHSTGIAVGNGYILWLYFNEAFFIAISASSTSQGTRVYRQSSALTHRIWFLFL